MRVEINKLLNLNKLIQIICNEIQHNDEITRMLPI